MEIFFIGTEIVHHLYGLFFQFCFIFTEGEKRGKVINCDAHDHGNLYYHAALQAVH